MCVSDCRLFFASTRNVCEVGGRSDASQRGDTETPDLTDDNAVIGLLTTLSAGPTRGVAAIDWRFQSEASFDGVAKWGSEWLV